MAGDLDRAQWGLYNNVLSNVQVNPEENPERISIIPTI